MRVIVCYEEFKLIENHFIINFDTNEDFNIVGFCDTCIINF